jgi:hypothetical protein
MRGFALVSLLILLVGGAACSSSTVAGTENGSDASTGGARGGSGGGGGGMGGGGSGGTADGGDGPKGTCPQPIAADAGVTSLDDLPVAALCAESPGRLIQWTTLCAGSIVVVQGQGVDCASYWLFDSATTKLQATAAGCNGAAVCTGGVAGFVFPTTCFNPTFSTAVVPLCPVDGGSG